MEGHDDFVLLIRVFSAHDGIYIAPQHLNQAFFAFLHKPDSSLDSHVIVIFDIQNVINHADYMLSMWLLHIFLNVVHLRKVDPSYFVQY